MAIDDCHPEYSRRKIEWEILRDCAEGQQAIRAAGTKYLPKLTDQSNEEYQAYLNRPVFYGATARTIDGLSGMIFRKPPQIEIPDGMSSFVDDLTLTGLSLQEFAEDVVENDLTVGRAGILVDHPTIAEGMTVATAERLNIRPFLKCYSAEQIFNWKTESRNNVQVLTQVRLWEWVEIPGGDEFDVKVQKQIRVLDFNEVGQYRQRVFVEVEGKTHKKQWLVKEEIIPTKGGAPLDVIPFFFVGVRNGQPSVEKPPLIDLANVNISHFVSSADLEHGAHFTGLPTAVITGHQTDNSDGGEPEEYRIGAATAWVFPNPETQAFYLEFQGQGLEALEKRVEKKEQYMAHLGARMLQVDKKAAETAETAQINRFGETSVLSSISQSVSQSIEKALRFMAEWAGYDPNTIVFNLNRDFLAVQMDSQSLMAIMQLWQSGGIAFSDLLDNLKKGEIVREERTEEEIRSEVEQENPFSANDLEPAL